MWVRRHRKFDYNLSPIRPLKELNKPKMGCASSQAAARGMTTKPEEGEAAAASIEPLKYPPAEAFEIPLEDEGEPVESIIKKHPPKRLQRLAETPAAPPSIDDLEEKLAKAEIRRKTYLQQKIDGIASLTKNHDPEEDQGIEVQDEKEPSPLDEVERKVDDKGTHHEVQD